MKIAVGAVLLFGTLLFSLSVFALTSRGDNTVITFDGAVFQPQEVTIGYGETVTFENTSDEPFWPASNLHPSHEAYRAFDPKQPIEAGDSWSFTFVEAGRWGFHDHITPTIKGVITVLDAQGKIQGSADCTQEAQKQQCWEQRILYELDTVGIDAAFDLFKKFYDSDPKFSEDCHDLAHLVGERYYKQFAEGELFNPTPATRYCGYGFFHGFMGTLLIESGDITLARDFCKYIDESISSIDPSANSSCYHGVGHGAVDGGDPRSWGDPVSLIQPALQLCTLIGGDPHLVQTCANGVFDAIGIAMDDGAYGLTLSPDAFYDLCERTEEIFKEQCYDKITSVIVNFTFYDLTDSFALIHTMNERTYFNTSLVSLSAAFGRASKHTQGEYNTFIEQCHTFGADSSSRCVSGYAIGLVELGPLNREYENGVEFCKVDLLRGDERQQCFSSVIANSSLVFSQEAMQGICDIVSKEADVETMPECAPAVM